MGRSFMTSTNNATDSRTLRPKGWAGTAWVVEKLCPIDAGEHIWLVDDVLFHNPTGEYRGSAVYRVRRAQLEMIE